MSAEEARQFGMVDTVLATHPPSPSDGSGDGNGGEDGVPQVAS